MIPKWKSSLAQQGPEGLNIAIVNVCMVFVDTLLLPTPQFLIILLPTIPFIFNSISFFPHSFLFFSFFSFFLLSAPVFPFQFFPFCSLSSIHYLCLNFLVEKIVLSPGPTLLHRRLSSLLLCYQKGYSSLQSILSLFLYML